MRNLKTLFLQPSEFFKDFTDEEYENQNPFKLKYWFIAMVVVSILNGIVINLIMPGLLKDIGIESLGETTFYAIQAGTYIISPLISSLICVNILYFVIKIFMGAVESKEIRNKKYFKSLLYIRYIVFSIVLSILSLITLLLIKDEKFQLIAHQTNNLFVKLWATYLLYGLLKYGLNTNKLHKILPTILYIFTIIFAVLSIIGNFFSLGM